MFNWFRTKRSMAEEIKSLRNRLDISRKELQIVRRKLDSVNSELAVFKRLRKEPKKEGTHQLLVDHQQGSVPEQRNEHGFPYGALVSRE